MVLSVPSFCLVLALENIPGVLLFVPMLWSVVRRGLPRNEDLLVSLICYATVCTLVLAAWPGANGRYAMPATLAIAAVAGLAYDRFAEQQRLLAGAALGIAGVLVAYQLVLNWIAMPLVSDKFRQQAILGHQISALTQPSGKLFVSNQAGDFNILAYVPHNVRMLPFPVIAKMEAPFWAIVTPEELATLRNGNPTRSIVPRLARPSKNPWVLVEVGGP